MSAVARTLGREVLEEYGWTMLDTRPLAFGHFHHLTPKPWSHSYPYPDFLHLIFLAEAEEYRRTALKRAGEAETGSRLTSIARAMRTITPDQQVLLRAALAARR